MKWLAWAAPAFWLLSPCATRAYAAPAIGATAANPTVIVVNQPTVVTVTSVIADPTVIPTGINLLRLAATGTPAILGQLHDDGLNGDAVAGDGTYTLQTTLNESAGGAVRLEVSAAFKGVLQRVLSNIMTITAAGRPTISAAASPAPNAAGWNTSNVTVTFTCADATSGISSCTPPVTVTTEGLFQSVTGTATNTAGFTATAFVALKIDKTGPSLTVQSPAAGATLFAPQATVSGTVSDLTSGLSAVTCNGVAATVSAGSFTCNLTLNTGAGTITVQAVDIAGNVSSASVNVSVLPAPLVTFTSPTNLSFVGTTPITRGTVSDPGSSVTVNGIAAPLAGSVFSVTVPLSEGSNTLAAIARNAAGNVGAASLTVTLDTTPRT